jgi:hypothetical protein
MYLSHLSCNFSLEQTSKYLREPYAFNEIGLLKKKTSMYFSHTLILILVLFYADILVPLDNYISRGTAHFLTCKEPDYQQSLWNMISSVGFFLIIFDA